MTVASLRALSRICCAHGVQKVDSVTRLNSRCMEGCARKWHTGEKVHTDLLVSCVDKAELKDFKDKAYSQDSQLQACS